MPSTPSRTKKLTTPLTLAAALLTTNAASGDVTQGGDVDGSNIGITGSGWVTADDGFVGGFNGSWTLGRDATASGTLTVKDPGTRLGKSILSVGHYGAGSVSVSGGAVLTTGSTHPWNTVFVGEGDGSVGHISVIGVDSQMVFGGGVGVGVGAGGFNGALGGTGSVFIGNGGLMTTPANRGAGVNTGSFTISGGTFQGGVMGVGGSNSEERQGTLLVDNGGNLTLAAGLTIYDAATITDQSSFVECLDLTI